MQSRFVAIQLEFFVFHDTRMHLITGDAMPKLSPTISNALVLLSRLLFAVVCFFAWKGKIGLPALLTLSFSTVLFWVGHRGLSTENQKIASFWAKGLFTIVGIMALLRHPIPCPKDAPECTPLPVVTAIMQYIEQVDGQTFLLFAVIAMAIKFIGVLSSAYAWHLLLQGQGLRFAYWQTTVTSFLIGRFIGTFLPSTMGLDGYTLYEAGKYSNEWTRVFTGKSIGKIHRDHRVVFGHHPHFTVWLFRFTRCHSKQTWRSNESCSDHYRYLWWCFLGGGIGIGASCIAHLVCAHLW
jgi:hypothetical protein